MNTVLYREATVQDVSALAKIRGDNLEDEKYWRYRILGYLECTHNPQMALEPRIIYVASVNETIIGFVAGHLTHRYNCEGELQWINVMEEYRRSGIASELVKILTDWFIEQKSYKICVDPGDDIARHFYEKNGAKPLNEHWMFWKDIRNITKKS